MLKLNRANFGQFRARLRIRSRVMKPFPGKHPTRVYINVQGRDPKQRFSYLGKPSVNWISKLMAMGFIREGSIVEFDRKNILVSICYSSSRFAVAPTVQTGTAFKLHYPNDFEPGVRLEHVYRRLASGQIQRGKTAL